MLKTKDRAFITRLGKRFRYIRINFEEALRLSPEERYLWAQDKIYDIRRKRYQKRGIPVHDIETVGDHTLDSIGMATLHTPDTCNRDTVERMILVHDMPQAIIDNAKCDPALNETDKARLADLAAQVIFEARPQAYTLWAEYQATASLEARVAKDIQTAQMMLKIAEYQELYPDISDNFLPYWRTLPDQWLSDTGRTIHRTVLAAHEMLLTTKSGQHNDTCAA